VRQRGERGGDVEDAPPPAAGALTGLARLVVLHDGDQRQPARRHQQQGERVRAGLDGVAGQAPRQGEAPGTEDGDGLAAEAAPDPEHHDDRGEAEQRRRQPDPGRVG
jgi:hypothetical protein